MRLVRDGSFFAMGKIFSSHLLYLCVLSCDFVPMNNSVGSMYSWFQENNVTTLLLNTHIYVKISPWMRQKYVRFPLQYRFAVWCHRVILKCKTSRFFLLKLLCYQFAEMFLTIHVFQNVIFISQNVILKWQFKICVQAVLNYVHGILLRISGENWMLAATLLSASEKFRPLILTTNSCVCACVYVAF